MPTLRSAKNPSENHSAQQNFKTAPKSISSAFKRITRSHLNAAIQPPDPSVQQILQRVASLPTPNHASTHGGNITVHKVKQDDLLNTIGSSKNGKTFLKLSPFGKSQPLLIKLLQSTPNSPAALLKAVQHPNSTAKFCLLKNPDSSRYHGTAPDGLCAARSICQSEQRFHKHIDNVPDIDLTQSDQRNYLTSYLTKVAAATKDSVFIQQAIAYNSFINSSEGFGTNKPFRGTWHSPLQGLSVPGRGKQKYDQWLSTNELRQIPKSMFKLDILQQSSFKHPTNNKQGNLLCLSASNEYPQIVDQSYTINQLRHITENPNYIVADGAHFYMYPSPQHQRGDSLSLEEALWDWANKIYKLVHQSSQTTQISVTSPVTKTSNEMVIPAASYSAASLSPNKKVLASSPKKASSKEVRPSPLLATTTPVAQRPYQSTQATQAPPISTPLLDQGNHNRIMDDLSPWFDTPLYQIPAHILGGLLHLLPSLPQYVGKTTMGKARLVYIDLLIKIREGMETNVPQEVVAENLTKLLLLPSILFQQFETEVDKKLILQLVSSGEWKSLTFNFLAEKCSGFSPFLVEKQRTNNTTVSSSPTRYSTVNKGKSTNNICSNPSKNKTIAKIRTTHERVVHLVNNSRLSKAMTALDNAAPAKPTPEVFQSLKDLHPPEITKLTNDMIASFQTVGENQPRANFSLDEILIMVSKLRKTSTPGPNKFRAEHLQQLVGKRGDRDKEEIQELLQWFLVALANNDLPSSTMSLLTASTLIPLYKEESCDPTKIRPIAMGDTLIKLVGKLLLRQHIDEINLMMGDLQYGVGRPNGCDAIIHSVNLAIQLEEQFDVMQLDFTNAFNKISRATILSEAAKHFPQMLRFLLLLYGKYSMLWTPSPTTPGSYTRILSREGCRQGDPLSPFLFALAILPLLVESNNILNSPKQHRQHNAGSTVVIQQFLKSFLDDFTVVGLAPKLQEVYNYIKLEGPKIGIITNSKSKILEGKRSTLPSSITTLDWTKDLQIIAIPATTTENEDILSSLSSDNVPKQSYQAMEDYGITVLGAPIGSDAYVYKFLLSKHQEFLTKATQLKALDNPQVQWNLLYYCFKAKAPYLMRSVAPEYTETFCADFDEMKRNILQTILDVQLDDLQWAQCRAAISNGGLGLDSTQYTRHAAFAASITENLSTLDNLFVNPKENFSNLCSNAYHVVSPPSPAKQKIQRQRHISNTINYFGVNNSNNYLDTDGTTEVDYYGELFEDSSLSIAEDSTIQEAHNYHSSAHQPNLGVAMNKPTDQIPMIKEYIGSFRLLTSFCINITPTNYGIGQSKDSSLHQRHSKLQREFTEAIMDKVESNELNLIKRKSREDSARMLSVADNKAGAFLRAVAKKNSTAMSKSEFRYAMYFRLGCNLPGITPSTTCPSCSKHPLIGLQGQHFHCCPRGNERIEKHNKLVNIVKQLAQMAGYMVSLEPHGCFPTHDTRKRPDGIIRNYTQTNQDCAYDVSITHPANSTSINQHKAHVNGGAAAKFREVEKKADYDTLCNANNLHFVPIVFETYGKWGKLGDTLIEDLIDKAAHNDTDIPTSVLKDFWRKRISLELQRENARQMISRMERAKKGIDRVNFQRLKLIRRDMEDEIRLVQEIHQ